MKTTTLTFTLALAALALPAYSQADGGRRAGQERLGGGQVRDHAARADRDAPGPEVQRMCALLVASAAEMDGDGRITRDAWRKVFRSAGEGETVALSNLRRSLLTTRLDRDADGKLGLKDLEAGFSTLDRDGDGALSAEELDGPGRGHARDAAADGRGAPGDGQGRRERRPRADGEAGGASADGAHAARWEPGVATMRFVARTADTDRSGSVSKEEWRSFLGSTQHDDTGALTDEGVAALFHVGGPLAERSSEGGRGRAFQPFSRLLDADDDGMVDSAAFTSLFDVLDGDQDGMVSTRELLLPRHPAEHGAGDGDGDGPRRGDRARERRERGN